MLRKFVYAGAMIVVTTGAAFAQSNLSIPFKEKESPPSQEQIDKRKAADKAYDAAIHKIPDKKTSADPWADVRSGSAAAKSKRQ